VIARFTAVIDDTATRRDVEAVVDLRLASESDRRRFERPVGGVRDTQTRIVLDRLVGAPPAR
jgi:hypothetical protein